MTVNPWVVEPEDVKIELTWTDLGGADRPFWIKAKKYLSIGEQRRMLKSISRVTTTIGSKKGERPSPEAQFEWTDYSFARCEAYLLDWSLMNGQDKRMNVSRETLESLHQDLFEIIDNALDEHERSQADQKKVTASSRKQKRTSA